MGANYFGFVVLWLLTRWLAHVVGVDGSWERIASPKKFQPTKLALDSSSVVCFEIVFMNCHCFGVAVFDPLRLKKKLFVFVFGSRLYCILFFPGWY